MKEEDTNVENKKMLMLRLKRKENKLTIENRDLDLKHVKMDLSHFKLTYFLRTQ